MDTRNWRYEPAAGAEAYTKEAHARTFEWIARHGIFAEGAVRYGRYEDSVISLEAAAQGELGLQPSVKNLFGNPASLRTPFAVCRLTIAAGSTKRRFVIGLYQIWWLPSPG
jgi:hypothetical protein